MNLPTRAEALARLNIAVIAYDGDRGPGNWSIDQNVPISDFPAIGLRYTLNMYPLDAPTPHPLMHTGHEPWKLWGDDDILKAAMLSADYSTSGTYCSIDGGRPDDIYYEVALVEVSGEEPGAA